MKKINLTRLSDKFAELVERYIFRNNITQTELANIVGMQRAHLNALLRQSPDRALTGYYLLKFIRKGIIKVSEIYGETENAIGEEEFWELARAEENLPLLSKIERIRKKGVDFERFLEIHFPNI